MVGSSRIDAVLVRDHFPKLKIKSNLEALLRVKIKKIVTSNLCSDLVTALAGLKMNNFTHFVQISRKKTSQTTTSQLPLEMSLRDGKLSFIVHTSAYCDDTRQPCCHNNCQKY